MSLLQHFREYIDGNRLLHHQEGILLAVSGGADSVVLCDLCYKAGIPFIIAHCNFQLRGEESRRDETFVRSLGTKYNVPVLVKHFDTTAYAANHKLSIQEAARVLRYDWFEYILKTEAQEPLPINVVATAHHADDNIETMLMHFFRGTGIHGLRGMLPKQQKIIRPLLFARKQDLLAYAAEQQLQWVEDSSNASDKYSRNYFRHHVIPLVQQVYTGVENNLLDNLQRFAETEVLYNQAIERYRKKLLEVKGNEVHIPVLKLRHVNPLHTVTFEIVKGYNFSAAQVNDIIGLLHGDTGKYVQSATHRIIRNRSWLIIAPLNNEISNTILIEKDVEEVRYPGGVLTIKKRPVQRGQVSSDNKVACLDAKYVQFPLILRPWKQGDYFYPLGMERKKKIARFLIDQKLSATNKEKVWVLEMDKKIIWVAGIRIDNRFKVTDATTRIIQISLNADQP